MAYKFFKITVGGTDYYLKQSGTSNFLCIDSATTYNNQLLQLSDSGTLKLVKYGDYLVGGSGGTITYKEVDTVTPDPSDWTSDASVSVYTNQDRGFVSTSSVYTQSVTTTASKAYSAMTVGTRYYQSGYGTNTVTYCQVTNTQTTKYKYKGWYMTKDSSGSEEKSKTFVVYPTISFSDSAITVSGTAVTYDGAVSGTTYYSKTTDGYEKYIKLSVDYTWMVSGMSPTHYTESSPYSSSSSMTVGELTQIGSEGAEYYWTSQVEAGGVTQYKVRSGGQTQIQVA